MENRGSAEPKQEVFQGYVECKAHGRQVPIPKTVIMWGEEADKVLRAAGILTEDEHHYTGDCPHCGSSLTVYKNPINPKATSEDNEPSSG